MTLEEVEILLDNYGRWMRSEQPLCLADGEDAPCGISSLWDQWIPSKGWDPGWGDQTAPESVPDPIDPVSAEATWQVIRKLQRRHRDWLDMRYVKHRYVDELMLGAAQRALLYRLEGE